MKILLHWREQKSICTCCNEGVVYSYVCATGNVNPIGVRTVTGGHNTNISDANFIASSQYDMTSSASNKRYSPNSKSVASSENQCLYIYEDHHITCTHIQRKFEKQINCILTVGPLHCVSWPKNISICKTFCQISKGFFSVFTIEAFENML